MARYIARHAAFDEDGVLVLGAAIAESDDFDAAEAHAGEHAGTDGVTALVDTKPGFPVVLLVWRGNFCEIWPPHHKEY